MRAAKSRDLLRHISATYSLLFYGYSTVRIKCGEA